MCLLIAAAVRRCASVFGQRLRQPNLQLGTELAEHCAWQAFSAHACAVPSACRVPLRDGQCGFSACIVREYAVHLFFSY
jgi:hypothetical protein